MKFDESKSKNCDRAKPSKQDTSKLLKSTHSQVCVLRLHEEHSSIHSMKAWQEAQATVTWVQERQGIQPCSGQT